MSRFLQKTLLVIAFFMVPVSCIHAEENNEISKIGSNYSFETASQQKPVAQSQTDTDTVRLALIKNNHQYVLITAGMFAFSLIVITFMMKTTPHHARDLVTIVGLVSVIFGTILMVLVVDTTDSLTAPMGIFGAIAGYLFGAAQKKESASE